MSDIGKLRKEIDRIDSEMARLFEERMSVVGKIGRYKKENNLKIFDPEREKQVIERNALRITDSSLQKYYKKFLIDLMDISKELQQDRLLGGSKIGYQGVKGAFSYIALNKLFGGRDAKSYTTFEDVFVAVEREEIEYGVIPIENSYTGEIGEVFDLLKKYSVGISRTYDLTIEQNLLGVKGANIDDLEEVYSHPQGFLQSEKFLKGRSWKTISLENTAVSAKYISEVGDTKKGAIGSIETAEIYGLEVLERGINSRENNFTKFIVISKEIEDKGDIFSLIITTEHKTGALAKVVKIVEKHGYNMLNIKSRPIKDVPWEYYFYLELEGNLSGAKELLKEIEDESCYLKVVGCYKR